MTQDIAACCEKLREAFSLIEKNNPALAMAAIRNTINFLEGLDSIEWIEPKPDNSEFGYDPGTLPDMNEEVLVTAESGSGKYRYIKTARYSPDRGWYGNFGNTARIIAWAYVEPYCPSQVWKTVSEEELLDIFINPAVDTATLDVETGKCRVEYKTEGTRR